MMETVINYALIQVTQILSVKMFAIIYQFYGIKIICMQRKKYLKFLINLKMQNRVSFAKPHPFVVAFKVFSTWTKYKATLKKLKRLDLPRKRYELLNILVV